MKHFKNGRAFNIAVAVFLALVLWLYVINVENPSGDVTFRNFPITLQGTDSLDAAGLMVTDLDRETLKIKVTGKRKTLMQISRDNVTADLDLSAITTPGRWRLTCKVSLGGTVNENSVSVSERKDFEVLVTVADKASKEIPIEGEFRGTLSTGYENDAIQLNPANLEVTGPEKQIEKISHALVTIQGEDLTRTLSMDMPFVLIDTDGNVMSTENMTFSAEKINITLPVVKVYEIPLAVEFTEGGGAKKEDVNCTISPNTVKLSGDEEVLSAMKELVVGQVDLSQVFTLKNFSFPIQVPQGIKLRSEETQAAVQVNLEELPMRSVSTSQITMQNIPRGWNATLVAESIHVWVRGKQEDIDAMAGDQVLVEVDLTDVHPSAGQHRVEAQVSLKDAQGVGVVGSDYSVAVNFSR